jgi:hypothetical protein
MANRRRRCAAVLDFVYVEHGGAVQGYWRGEVLDEESSKGRWRQTVRQGAERALGTQLYSKQEAVWERGNDRHTDGQRPLMAMMSILY